MADFTGHGDLLGALEQPLLVRAAARPIRLNA
jgi:hypothetical protein